VPAEPVRAEVQIRYRHAAAGAWVERLEGDRAAVRFDEPQAAVTPGQAAVFYRGERVVGGGWIEKSIMQNEECRMQNAE
jgi:tRNA-specific 2-thiouridylase